MARLKEIILCTPMSSLTFFATTPKGLELLLVDELRALGAEKPAEKLGGVTFQGDLALAYRACLWSRLANRILLKLKEAALTTPSELYEAIQQIDWSEHLSPTGTLSVHCSCSQSEITHSLFAAQKVKDAIVDQFRARFGVRPSVDKQKADVQIDVYLHRNHAVISLDLSGESLHKRGYRLMQVQAPLKENLAAAILLRAGWGQIAKRGGSLLDPMCGSGTLLIEAALMAGNSAPGLKREYFGFMGWLKHDEALWHTLREEAQQQATLGLAALPPIVGYDHDPDAIKAAFDNINRAGLCGKVHVEKRELTAFAPTAKQPPGLVVVNPPYGERIGEVNALQSLYAELGQQLKKNFQSWQAAVFTGNPDLGKQMGLRARKYYALFNGPLPCKLLLFEVLPEQFINLVAAHNEWQIRDAKRRAGVLSSKSLEMFVNRLRKNLKHQTKQAKRSGRDTYRLYDADLPDYAFVIDVLKNTIDVREYKAPTMIDPNKVLQRRHAVLAVLPELLNVEPAHIFFSIIAR